MKILVMHKVLLILKGNQDSAIESFRLNHRKEPEVKRSLHSNKFLFFVNINFQENDQNAKMDFSKILPASTFYILMRILIKNKRALHEVKRNSLQFDEQQQHVYIQRVKIK